jgi:deoxyribodipyrimidine photo-lyase
LAERRHGDSDDAPALVWLWRELRLRDNPVLAAAIASGRPVLPVFVLDDSSPGAWAPGGAARWWLHGSLAALAADLAMRGAPLALRRGRIATELPRLAAETGAAELHAGLAVEPWAREATAALRQRLGVPLHLHRSNTLFQPDAIRTRTGGPFLVFTPFARACREHGPPPEPAAAPARIRAAAPPASDRLDGWGLRPARPDWAGGLRAAWQPGEAGAQYRLQHFVARQLASYDELRNFPSTDGTARLSPHLHWGELSPGEAWHAAAAGAASPAATAWQNELLWREFSAHLLWHHPDLPEMPVRDTFARIRWRDAGAELDAWQRGRTGIPIVDAGMRQLWRTGWMHNRVRMIAGSFLTKHLLQPWQRGAAWFWDTLVDADLASNSAQWQWVAGSSADAAPFFRIFNPVLQGRKFDPDGAYVRAWVPELERLPVPSLHAPWQAGPAELSAAGVTLGRTYPRPVVDLAAGRARALAAFRAAGA